MIDELAYARASDPESRTTYTYDYTQNTGYSRERFVNGSPSTRPTLTHVYSYDLQGRLFSATVTNYNDAGTGSSITRSTYDYGHTGIRVSATNEIDSTADGTFETRTKIEYLIDHHNHTGYQQVIRESHYDAATGKLVKTVDYTFGHDEISQTVIIYDSAGAEVSRDKQWFLHDGKASVRGLLDAASAILTIAGNEQIYFYDAYGSLLNMQASQAATTLLYNGEMFDALTGNQYLRARYYNPLNAQFNRLDPFFGNHQDPQSFNKYAYVHGNPIMLTDPTGKFASLGGALLGGAIRAGLVSVGIGAVVRVPLFLYEVFVGGKELEAALWDLGTGLATDFAVGAVLGGAGAGLVRFASNGVKLRLAGQSVTQFRNLRLPGSLWKIADASRRGFAIEAKILSRPAAFLGRQINNFPIIDDFVVRGGRGIATSIKSIDLTRRTYQTANGITSALRRYARVLENMQSASGGGFAVSTAAGAANRVTDKILVIALEQGAATGTQAGAIARFLRDAPRLYPNVRLVLQFIQ